MPQFHWCLPSAVRSIAFAHFDWLCGLRWTSSQNADSSRVYKILTTEYLYLGTWGGGIKPTEQNWTANKKKEHLNNCISLLGHLSFAEDCGLLWRHTSLSQHNRWSWCCQDNWQNAKLLHCLPGQLVVCAVQFASSVLWPGHVCPPSDGGGLVHSRRRVVDPVPHVTEQSVQALHSDHWPLTRNRNKTLTCTCKSDAYAPVRKCRRGAHVWVCVWSVWWYCLKS